MFPRNLRDLKLILLALAKSVVLGWILSWLIFDGKGNVHFGAFLFFGILAVSALCVFSITKNEARFRGCIEYDDERREEKRALRAKADEYACALLSAKYALLLWAGTVAVVVLMEEAMFQVNDIFEFWWIWDVVPGVLLISAYFWLLFVLFPPVRQYVAADLQQMLNAYVERVEKSSGFMLFFLHPLESILFLAVITLIRLWIVVRRWFRK